MPMKRLGWRGGVDTTKSPSLNNTGWTTSNCIRWRESVPESLLGFAKVTLSAISGIARAIHYWSDLTGIGRFAIGSNTKLYLAQNSVLQDITPTSGFSPGLASGSGTPFTLLIWSLDNFGQNLIACPSEQGLFVWVPPVITNPATLIATAPTKNLGAMVMDQQQIVLTWGASPLTSVGTLDPMMVRWCDQSDYTVWIASTTNQAGSYRLPHGSRIVGGLQIPNLALLWTDIGVWGIQYIGFPLVFSFQNIGQNCGLIAQKAAAILGSVVYWMSDHGFFRLVGSGAEQIPCPVWDTVFKNIGTNHVDKCLAGTDYHYSEVWWFYPSETGSGEIDSYVKVNIQEGEWDYGPATVGSPNVMARTAWTDQNTPGQPISVDLSGVLQQSNIDFTQDGGAAMPSSIRSGYADISDGGQLMFVDQFVPDFLWDGTNPSLSVTFYFREWPGDSPTSMGPFTITPTTETISLRQARTITVSGVTATAYPAIRAREVAIQIDLISGWFRLGNCRVRAAPAGKLGG